jgi:hypothetical protein
MMELVLKRASQRKMRLFDCACWRQRARRFLNSGGQRLLAVVLLAEGRADGAKQKVPPDMRRNYGLFFYSARDSLASTVQIFTARPRLGVPSILLCKLFREVLGNPFAPLAIEPAWLDPDVLALATSAYQERALPSGHLDNARLGVLADALEDAGASGPLLEHLRSPGPHVRGCHALDAILGRT